MIEKDCFGWLEDGRRIMRYTIYNRQGEWVELLDFGASIHSIYIKDKFGVPGDCVLGAPTCPALMAGALEGSMIGRCANRIAEGICTIAGKVKHLETNQGNHFLHGASGNYAKRLFTYVEGSNEQTVTFFLRDMGEGGFDSIVDVQVSYTFDEAHRLTIQYEMKAVDLPTVLCPTNHAYFNLLNFSDAREHVLYIPSKKIALKGESGVPEGEVFDGTGSAYDFSVPCRIADAMKRSREGIYRGGPFYDDAYLLSEEHIEGKVKLAAVLHAPGTGRKMKVYTDMPALILFTPANCGKKPGKDGRVYPDYGAVCLETQFVPNAVNCKRFDSPVFDAGQTLKSTTVYAFEAQEEGGYERNNG